MKKFKLPKNKPYREKALRLNPERDDRVMSYDHIRKYHDALLFGAQERGTCMSMKYNVEMKKYLQHYKNEVAANKKLGKVDEYDSDPFSFTLVMFICMLVLDSGDIFSLVGFLMQWNCMTRSINIDYVGFSNLKRGTDSLVIKYDDTKADKTGENCHNKKLYTNPKDPIGCVFLAIGIYCAMEHKSLENKNCLFLSPDADLGNA